MTIGVCVADPDSLRHSWEAEDYVSYVGVLISAVELKGTFSGASHDKKMDFSLVFPAEMYCIESL